METSSSSTGGWTILEIMIVVSIIGVMAVIAIPSWTAALEKSEREVCNRNAALIFEQMNIYCLERNLPCSVDVFADILEVKDELCPDTGGMSARYVKRRNAFACPSNSDQETQADYRLVRDGNQIIDIECDFEEDHNVD